MFGLELGNQNRRALALVRGKRRRRRRSSKMLISPQVEIVLVLAKKSNTQS